MMYAERTTHAEQRPYAALELPHHWPMVVREQAVELARGGVEADIEPPADAEISADPETTAETATPPDPSPRTDPEDELYLLGERCAQTYMQADALHYRAMKLLAEYDRRSGWKDTVFSSTAEWLAWRISIKLGAARERLRTALALEKLPLTAEAMKRGELSFTKVRALTRVARPDNESTLLEFARAGSAANLERLVRGWKALEGKSEVTAEQIRHRSRRLSAWVDDDGMVVVKGRLDPEVGALFMRAVEAAGDALYRGERGGETEERGLRCGGEPNTELEETTPEQRRADAVGLMAERALGAGFGVGGGGGDAQHPEEDSTPVSGTRAERYQVMLHVDAGTLEEDGEAGRSELEDGTRVSDLMKARDWTPAGDLDGLLGRSCVPSEGTTGKGAGARPTQETNHVLRRH